MRESLRSRRNLFLMALAVLLLALVAWLAFRWLGGVGGGRQLPRVGPTVMLTAPRPEQAAIPADSVAVAAVAYGENPVHHVELWLDGALAQTVYNQDLETAAPVEVTFNTPLTEGGHLLFVRAVDTHSLVGQSAPVMAAGALPIAGEGPHLLVEVAPGDTLEETLEANGVDLPAVLPGNPGLSSGEAGPGTVVALPLEPEDGGGVPGASPPSPPEPPQGTGLDVLQVLPVGFPPLPLLTGRVLAPPAAPSGLQAAAGDCKVTLSWTDNSDQEAGYNLWLTGLGIPPRVAARAEAFPGTGPVWVELEALKPGDFVYWVEAYNSLGAQPSGYAPVTVSGGCPSLLGDRLEVEALDFSVSGPYDRAYCYISFEGRPEVRLPAAQNQFVSVAGGQGDIAAWAGGERSFVLPVPEDGDLALEGECWGWAGDSLTKLGTFQRTSLQEEWDGRRLSLDGGGFEIGLMVRFSPADSQLVTFASDDPGIPIPYDLQLERPVSLADVGLDPFEAYDYLDRGQDRVLTWKWDGDPSTITGFTVLLNGIPFEQVNSPDARSAEFQAPGFCGTKLEIAVVATAGDRRSLPSTAVSDSQHQCFLYVLVDFQKVIFHWTNDSINPTYRCDSMDAYFNISVEESFSPYRQTIGSNVVIPGRKWIKHFNGGGFYRPVKCYSYDLNKIAGSFYTDKERDPTQIVFPVKVGENYGTDYEIRAEIWDQDDNPDDIIGRYAGHLHFNSGTVEDLLKSMGRVNDVIYHYREDSYTGIFDGDAKSTVYIDVTLYRENPLSGTVSLPSNAPPSEETTAPTEAPGAAFQPSADLEVKDLLVDSQGGLYVRVANNGPDDLQDVDLTIELSSTSNDPGLNLPQNALNRYSLDLGAGAQVDLLYFLGHDYQLDLTKYDYSFTATVKGEGEFSEGGTGNNTRSRSFQASELVAVPEPLIVDLELADIRVGPYGGWRAVVRNNGPNAVEGIYLEVLCEGTEVSRFTGEGKSVEGLKDLHYHNDLDVGGTRPFSPYSLGFGFDPFLNWYVFSCQVKTDAFLNDPNPSNNFLTQALH